MWPQQTSDFEAHLAAFACRTAHSLGRQIAEPSSHARTEFQRDRDRIIHSTAFRRLEYKTQVFVNHEGDLFRTRLTHSLEVAQIARAIARNLRINEDLVEAISLAHDLGHTPFGHAGQDALNACMQEFGGFEHNLQSLRVVDGLEQHYAQFDGLNLMYETREGILKHCSNANAAELGALGQRFLQHKQPSLEAQVTNIADEIAYNNHDVDDGLRSGLLNERQLTQVELYARFQKEVAATWPGLGGRQAIYETLRRIINALIVDLIQASQEAIQEAQPKSVEDVRNCPPLIRFSEPVRAQARELKQFLHANLYRHFQVNRMTSKARRVVNELFAAFLAEPGLLPPNYQAARGAPAALQARQIADYIAGMTDRYAMREHRRLFSIDEI